MRDLADLGAGLLPVEPGVEVHALAAAGDGHELEAHALDDGPQQLRHADALGQPDALARVEVEHEPVGVALRPFGPNRHCGTCTSSAATCASQVSVATSLTIG